MSRAVMTIGNTQRKFVLRGTPIPFEADYRELGFQCEFVDDAVNGPPSIHIEVTQVGRGVPDDVRVELRRVGNPGEALLGNEVAIESGFARLGRMRPRRLTNEAAPSTPEAVFLTNTGLNALHGFETPAFGGGGLFVDDDFEHPRDPGGGGVGRLVIDRPLVTRTDPRGRWKLRITNLSRESGEFFVRILHPESVQTLETTRVPFQLLNRVFSEALLFMVPTIRINAGKATVGFGQQFKKMTGLGDISEPISGVINDVNLQAIDASAGQGEDGRPTIALDLEFESEGDEVELPVAGGFNIPAMHMRVGFSFFLSLSSDFFGGTFLRVNKKELHPRLLNMEPFVATNFPRSSPSAPLPVRLVLEKIEEARSKIEIAFRRAIADGLRDFFTDLLVNVVEKSHTIHTLTCDRDNIIVEHHAIPGNTSEDLQIRPRTGGGADVPLVVEEHPVAEKLRVGEIDHIVFLMMENRSFDHMLGYRGLRSDVNVNGLTGDETNSLPEGNPAYPVSRLTETAGIPTPPHDHDHTLEQIAGGQMSGFAKVSADRPSNIDPGLVMGYFTETELPMYEFLANNFAVCDAWFSSHPGSTFANRFCATTGQCPELENFELGDDRIGYFKGLSIFDVLTNVGEDWAYVEGNIGFLRMFDRYRLDTDRVIPFDDYFGDGITNTFINRVESGSLPAVTFIDPRFIDVPPAFDANDDLPPADVCHGQRLVKEIYDLLTGKGTSTTWPKTLFVITYDEHGGFFDHVPPPGTLDGNPVPLVTPGGATHLGVRVPAFLVSPWVDAGTVISTQFDHTSIIKTILERFHSTAFANTGLTNRSGQANSLLGVDVLRDRARTDTPDSSSVGDIVCKATVGPRGPASGDDFHAAMRLMSLPSSARRRLTT